MELESVIRSLTAPKPLTELGVQLAQKGLCSPDILDRVGLLVAGDWTRMAPEIRF
jgi:hypothetical protein